MQCSRCVNDCRAASGPCIIPAALASPEELRHQDDAHVVWQDGDVYRCSAGHTSPVPPSRMQLQQELSDAV